MPKVPTIILTIIPPISPPLKLGVRLDHQGPRSPYLQIFAGHFLGLYIGSGLVLFVLLKLSLEIDSQSLNFF
jgi:hypothetical protein